jgi:hypothetical protein
LSSVHPPAVWHNSPVRLAHLVYTACAVQTLLALPRGIDLGLRCVCSRAGQVCEEKELSLGKTTTPWEGLLRSRRRSCSVGSPRTKLSGKLGWRPWLDSRLTGARLIDKRSIPGRLDERGLQHPELLITQDPAEPLRDRVTAMGSSYRFGESDLMSPSTSAAVTFRTVQSSIPRKWRRSSTELGNPTLPSGP